MTGTGAPARRAAEPLPQGSSPASGYEVIAHLSRGRRLDVYDAWSAERETRCVLKMLRPERRDDPSAREKLLREGRLLERLTHPHIVRGYETIREPDPIVVMETLAGQTLGRVIEDHAPLTASAIGHLGLHVAAATAYLHRHGYLHLDLKPDNIVAEAGRARLIDLSLTRPPGVARAGLGTWCYLAPEQALGGELGPAADVWGIGVTLFEAASGLPAFDEGDGSLTDPAAHGGSHTSWETGDGDDGWDGDYPQLHERAPRLSEVSDQPEQLCAVIDSCLEPDPTRRPEVSRLMGRIEVVAGLPARERRHKA